MPDVEVLKQASWGATRDNLVLGSEANGIDGAHILSPMPYLMTTGKITQGGAPMPMYILARLNLDAQAISVANEYKDLKVGATAAPLKEAFAKKRAAGGDPKVAMTFPGGTHDLWIRYWLAAGGIDPDKDVSLITVPPPQMVANMKVGTMDAFCVGEPWTAQLVNQKLGYTAVNTAEIWTKHPEKALGLRADWVDKHPKAAQALLMAVMEAQVWCDKLENREEMCRIVGTRAWFNVPVADILPRQRGEYDYGLDGKAREGLARAHEVLARQRLLPVQVARPLVRHREHPLGQVRARARRRRSSTKVNRADLWREAAQGARRRGRRHPGDRQPRARRPSSTARSSIPPIPGAYLASLPIKRVA